MQQHQPLQQVQQSLYCGRASHGKLLTHRPLVQLLGAVAKVFLRLPLQLLMKGFPRFSQMAFVVTKLIRHRLPQFAEAFRPFQQIEILTGVANKVLDHQAVLVRGLHHLLCQPFCRVRST